MKKMSKIVAVLLIVMMMVTVSTTVMAAQTQVSVTPGNMLGDSSVNTAGISGLGNKLITILTTIGIVVSVIVLVVLGIKYMMGSAEEKAEYKKTLMPYVIGAGLVFAASSIAQIVYSFMQGV
ncbi:MAG: hypothetical protein HFH47_02790 [Bacilli bacterium]|nr:hypothetical protein [Bacilli bacterium]